MTPAEGDAVTVGDVLGELGVKSVEELRTIVTRQKNREGYESRKVGDLQRQVDQLAATLEGKKEEEIFELGDNADDTVKRLARELLAMKKQFGAVVNQVMSSPEDADLEDHLRQAKEEYPEIAVIKDPVRRITALRRIARDLKKAETESASGSPGSREHDTSVAHLAIGSSPVSQRSGLTEEQALEKYRRDRVAASGPGKLAVDAKYRALYPSWDI